MKNLLCFFIHTISLICSFNLSFGQVDTTMKLLDFSNKERREIRIKEDWANQKIFLISFNNNSSDSLEVNDVAEIDTVISLLSSFIRIDFRYNGGSGVHLRVSKLFCLNKGQIYESLSLLTRQESYSSDGVLQEKYWVDIQLSFSKRKIIAILTENEQDKNGNVWKKDSEVLLHHKDLIFFSKRKMPTNLSFCKSMPQRKVAYYLLSLKKETYINYEGFWYIEGAKCYIRI